MTMLLKLTPFNVPPGPPEEQAPPPPTADPRCAFRLARVREIAALLYQADCVSVGVDFDTLDHSRQLVYLRHAATVVFVKGRA